jgi:hypothetical protein
LRVDQNVIGNPPRKVGSRFELVASRMADAWLRAGAVTVTPEDLRIAGEFLEQTGWSVRDVGGGLVRLIRIPGARGHEMTREAVVLIALRRLAGRD